MASVYRWFRALLGQSHNRWHNGRRYFWRRIYFGKDLASLPNGAIVLFPYLPATALCGLAGIVAFKKPTSPPRQLGVAELEQAVETLDRKLAGVDPSGAKSTVGASPVECPTVSSLMEAARQMKTRDRFIQLFSSPELQDRLGAVVRRVQGLVKSETAALSKEIGRGNAQRVAALTDAVEGLKDVAWCIDVELLNTIEKIRQLMAFEPPEKDTAVIAFFSDLNRVLSSIDRLEVRGRDSAGVSLLFQLTADQWDAFESSVKSLSGNNPLADLERRSDNGVLINRSVRVQKLNGDGNRPLVSALLTYKVAAEIGRLGDNIRFLRRQIQQDPVLQAIVRLPREFVTISSHTRWASVGAINEANCHPVDARSLKNPNESPAPIHVCLNGDIDNFMDLKIQFEASGDRIPEEITTDTKIIPLQIRKYLLMGEPIEEAFRKAVGDFQGSHAISMHTPLAPGKLFLAQRGSGQAVFIGIAEDHYMPTSEVYGFIETTNRYVKMDGESVVNGPNGPVQGQIFILDQEAEGGLSGIQVMRYDGTAVTLTEADIKTTNITSRDIDRQAFPHYFLKEINEAPASVEKTLLNRWKISDKDPDLKQVTLDESTFPPLLKAAFERGDIRRIFLVGQGTAGIAAIACADVIRYYLNAPLLTVNALKASELSGFLLEVSDTPSALSDALVIAISQSGTTTDTNRAVDMVRERGARTLAIVNRRDSDLTFKVDGVMYTSSGRDIEMSVASTKAFYSQIVAGILIGLQIAEVADRRSDQFISDEIEQLMQLPDMMRRVIGLNDAIAESARRLATAKTYWAAVGSGPNKAAADEIRIKLSELCYKTISSDYVEDKKHIDLSSEPLIIVCAAGARGTVIGDIVKDTAIFKAHKAAPVVIADEGEPRFSAYAEDVFHVPVTTEHLAPILNTLVGHLWGYHAALAINESSKFLYDFRDQVRRSIETQTGKGMDIYEIVLENAFRQLFGEFYNVFRKRKVEGGFPAAMGLGAASDLTLLLKYLAGRLPASDFEIDFGKKGTARNIIDAFFQTIGSCINAMARPVDAIKHQAKTVTVGTSRIAERIEGILFDTIDQHGMDVAQIINKNVMVLRNLQRIVSEIKGSILYRIGGLDVLGEITGDTTIEIVKKTGVLAPLASRVETDNRLKGTKAIIVRRGDVYIGKGRKDHRSIIIIPIMSDSAEKPNAIEYLLLLNIGFLSDVPLADKIKALGGKYQHIRNIVQENSLPWEDRFLEMVEMEELFGRSAEKIGEAIAGKLAGK
ncbi:MAG: SIS domain-containing protein [Desulfobacterales bacterium]